jgi:hypothetical protein
MLWFVHYLLLDYLLRVAIITNLRGSGFSYIYFDLGDSDTGEQTAVTRSTSQFGRIFTAVHGESTQKPGEDHLLH